MSNCVSCPAFELLVGKELPTGERLGTCRFSPPVVIPIVDKVDSHFPVVTETNWCFPGRQLMISSPVPDNYRRGYKTLG